VRVEDAEWEEAAPDSWNRVVARTRTSKSTGQPHISYLPRLKRLSFQNYMKALLVDQFSFRITGAGIYIVIPSTTEYKFMLSSL
jgi:hypothetical protein